MAFSLTDEEINALVDSAVLLNFFDIDGTIDNSTNANTGLLSSAVVHNSDGGSSCVVGNCMYFPGTNSFINLEPIP